MRAVLCSHWKRMQIIKIVYLGRTVAMRFKSKCSKLTSEVPGFVVAVYDHGRWHRSHHQEVRESQIDYKKIGWGAERLGRREYKNDTAITDSGDKSCTIRTTITFNHMQSPLAHALIRIHAKLRTENDHSETQDWVPQWVQWWKLIPIWIDQMQHIGWDFVDNGQVAAKSASASWGGPGFKMWLN